MNFRNNYRCFLRFFRCFQTLRRRFCAYFVRFRRRNRTRNRSKRPLCFPHFRLQGTLSLCRRRLKLSHCTSGVANIRDQRPLRAKRCLQPRTFRPKSYIKYAPCPLLANQGAPRPLLRFAPPWMLLRTSPPRDEWALAKTRVSRLLRTLRNRSKVFAPPSRPRPKDRTKCVRCKQVRPCVRQVRWLFEARVEHCPNTLSFFLRQKFANDASARFVTLLFAASVCDNLQGRGGTRPYHFVRYRS